MSSRQFPRSIQEHVAAPEAVIHSPDADHRPKVRRRGWAADDPRREIPKSVRQAWGRAGGLETAARGHVNTWAARAAFDDKLVERASAGQMLSGAERAKVIERGRRAHMAKMTARSVTVRQRRSTGDMPSR